MVTPPFVLSSYETTSSEESSGDEKPKASAEEEDSSEVEVEVEVEKEKEAEPQPERKPEEGAEAREEDAEASAEGGAAGTAAEKDDERDLLDPDGSQALLEAAAEGWDGEVKCCLCSRVVLLAISLWLEGIAEQWKVKRESKKNFLISRTLKGRMKTHDGANVGHLN